MSSSGIRAETVSSLQDATETSDEEEILFLNKSNIMKSNLHKSNLIKNMTQQI